MKRVSERIIREAVAAIGGDLVIGPQGRSYVVDAWTPAGLVWQDTGCHALVESWETDAAGCRAEAFSRISRGTAQCDNPECDTCYPVEG